MTPRYCGHCGGRLEEREIDAVRRLVCPACRAMASRNPVPAAGCVVEDGGRVVLARRKYTPWRDHWSFPSGFVECDESVEETARRETREVTGLEVHLRGLFGVYGYRDDPCGNGIVILYRAAVVGGRLAPGDDTAEVRFFARDALPPDDEIGFASHRLALARWRDER